MIDVTENAIAQIKRIKTRDSLEENTYLRVKVVGGGCSGMSYNLDFEKESITENDQEFDVNGVKIVVDKKSLLFLNGTKLDFSDGLNGSGFEFVNPNAKRTCGCGSSFAV